MQDLIPSAPFHYYSDNLVRPILVNVRPCKIRTIKNIQSNSMCQIPEISYCLSCPLLSAIKHSKSLHTTSHQNLKLSSGRNK